MQRLNPTRIVGEWSVVRKFLPSTVTVVPELVAALGIFMSQITGASNVKAWKSVPMFRLPWTSTVGVSLLPHPMTDEHVIIVSEFHEYVLHAVPPNRTTRSNSGSTPTPKFAPATVTDAGPLSQSVGEFAVDAVMTGASNEKKLCAEPMSCVTSIVTTCSELVPADVTHLTAESEVHDDVTHACNTSTCLLDTPPSTSQHAQVGAMERRNGVQGGALCPGFRRVL